MKKKKTISIQLNDEAAKKLEELKKKYPFVNISKFVLDLILKAEI